MSKSVVPAAAVAHAKHLVSNKKLTKRPEAKKSAEDEQQASDHKDADANAVQTANAQNHELSMSEAPLGTFSFANALSDAAASTAALTVETSAQDDGGSMGEERDGSGPILLVAAGGLAIAGGVAAFSGGGGSKNQAPTVSAASQAVTTDEDTAVSGTVSASDPDGDTLSYSAAGATKGTVTINSSGAFTYTPNANASGSDVFTVTVTDPKGLTATQTVNVTITPVNDAPAVAATQTVEGVEDEDATGTVAGTDVDGDTLTYAVSGDPEHGTVTIDEETGEFVYTPAANYNGADTFEVTVSDGTLTATQTVTVNVAAVNDDPVFTNAPIELNAGAGETVTGAVDATDVDEGDTLTYSVVDAVENATITIDEETGAFTYTPNEDFEGVDTFDVVVTDSAGATSTQTVTVNVTLTPPVNEFDIDGDSPSGSAVNYSDQLTAGADVIVDDANIDTNALLSGLEDGDLIRVLNASEADYNFKQIGNDIEITYGADNGAYNIILLEDAVANSVPLIHNYDTAAQAVGFDFMQFA